MKRLPAPLAALYRLVQYTVTIYCTLTIYPALLLAAESDVGQ